MQPIAPIPADQNPWVALSLLAAPAILTNASTVLALGTSNRLARASDRARAAAAFLLTAASPHDPADPAALFRREDFDHALRRAGILVKALRRYYLAAGCFASATCIVLIGSMARYLGITPLDLAGRALAVGATLLGVGALVSGSLRLVGETRIALDGLNMQREALDRLRADSLAPR
jgi:hypothetical protein